MEAERKLSAEAGAVLREGIGLVLFRWSALQLAVDNEWGGRDSRRKAEQLGTNIFSWFNHSIGCNYKSIESLREANHHRVSIPHIRQVVNDDDDSDEDDDDRDDSIGNDDSSNMMVDTHESPSNLNPVDKSDNELKPNLAVEADGWEVVGPKRNRGERN